MTNDAQPRSPRADADELHRLVRDALGRLHDLPYLQAHPLAALVRGAEGVTAATVGRALHRCLVETVAALAPAAPGGAARAAARVHRLLVLRYVEAQDAPNVWRELGVGKTEYYHEHAHGVRAVVAALRERWEAARGAEPRSDRRLPVALTSLVGRADAVAAVATHLREHRMVTLTGPPGVGKTRLALAVAGAGSAADPWFVDLSAVHDREGVRRSVLAALGATAAADGGWLDAAAARLDDGPALLFLDNCEHVLADAADTAGELLGRCPDLRVLATSREPLGLPGEAVWPVPPLEAPPADAVAVDEIGRHDAVRLFVDRARLVWPGFALTPESAPAVAAICRELDGLPLAIELAAARARALGPAAIAARLDDRFRLLTHGPRMRHARHHTLRATFDWSHELLSDQERALLRRLAVCVGGFTLEAAEAVGTGDPVAPHEIVDVLASLVDRSWVAVDPGRVEPRYRLLETARAYAAEELRATGEDAAARGRHRDWFLAWGQRTARACWHAPPGPAGTALAADHENLRAAALGALGDATLAEQGARLAVAMASALRLERATARLADVTDWLEQALGTPSPALETVRLALLLELGWTAWHADRIDRAERAFRAAEQLSRATDNHRALVNTLYGLAECAYRRGELPASVGLIEQGSAIAQAAGDAASLAQLRHGLAVKLRYTGDFDRAWALEEQSRAGHAALGNQREADRLLVDLVLIAHARGDLPTARRMLEAAFARLVGGQPIWLGSALSLRSQVEACEGDPAAAWRSADEAVSIFRSAGSRGQCGRALWVKGRATYLLGRPDEAERLYREGLVLVGENRLGALEILEDLAQTLVALGQAGHGARILGATAAFREAAAAPVPPVDAPTRTATLTAARDALGADAFERAFAVGQRTPIEDVRREVLPPPGMLRR